MIPRFTRNLPVYDRQIEPAQKGKIFIRENTPADTFPVRPLPQALKRNPTASYVGFITPPPSALTIRPSDLIVQPKDTFGLKVQAYFSSKERYLRRIGLVQQLLTRQMSANDATLQMIQRNEILKKARGLRNDVRGLTEQEALQSVGGGISNPSAMATNDVNSLVRSSIPTGLPSLSFQSPNAVEMSQPQAEMQAEMSMGGAGIPRRQLDVASQLETMAQLDQDESVGRASGALADTLRTSIGAEPSLVEEASGAVQEHVRNELTNEKLNQEIQAIQGRMDQVEQQLTGKGLTQREVEENMSQLRQLTNQLRQLTQSPFFGRIKRQMRGKPKADLARRLRGEMDAPERPAGARGETSDPAGGSM